MIRSHDKHSPEHGYHTTICIILSACGGSRHLWIPVFARRKYATACVSVNHKTGNDQFRCLIPGSGLPWQSGEAAGTAQSRTLIINTQTDEYMTGCRSEDRPEYRSHIIQYTPVTAGSTTSGSQYRLMIARVKSARGTAVREPTISSKRCLDLSSIVRCVNEQASPK